MRNGVNMSAVDVVAASAAIAAAAVVAWQSYETRRSANASNQAAQAANSAVELSRSTLEIARREEGHSRTLITSTIKGQMDSNILPVTFEVAQFPFWPPTLRQWKFPDKDEVVSEYHTFRAPDDLQRTLVMKYGFVLTNENRYSITLDTEPWLDHTESIRKGKFELAPDMSYTGWIVFERSIEDWVSRSKAYLSHGAPLDDSFSFMVTSTLDAGAIDKYEMRMSGTPLVPIDHGGTTWRLREVVTNPESQFPEIAPTARRVPTRRTYWSSIAQREQLPEPE
jgi:hypothetical protein